MGFGALFSSSEVELDGGQGDSDDDISEFRSDPTRNNQKTISSSSLSCFSPTQSPFDSRSSSRNWQLVILIVSIMRRVLLMACRRSFVCSSPRECPLCDSSLIGISTLDWISICRTSGIHGTRRSHEGREKK